MYRKHHISTTISLILALAAAGAWANISVADDQAQPIDPGAVELAREEPGLDYRRTATITRYVKGQCSGPFVNSHKTELLERLREDAAARGADYVKVISSEAQMCRNDMFQVTGVAYQSPAGDNARLDSEHREQSLTES